MLSKFTGLPLEISEEEAGQLAEAIGEITAHYGVQISKPAMLWGNLIATASMVYGPRIFLVLAMRSEARRQARAAKPMNFGNVVDLNGVPVDSPTEGEPLGGGPDGTHVHKTPGGIEIG